jgi:hypothetical protein
MKFISLILLFASACTHNSSPSWVQGIRSGEERLTLHNGEKLLFRRIAGAGLKPDQACQKAIFEAEKDIQTANPDFSDLPYSVEVLYYDKAHEDCAVTLALNPLKQAKKAYSSEVLTRQQLAEKYAITGLQMHEFMRLAKVKVVDYDIDFRNECWQSFYKSGASYHGPVTICWIQGAIVGYCKNGVCNSK